MEEDSRPVVEKDGSMGKRGRAEEDVGCCRVVVCCCWN